MLSTLAKSALHWQGSVQAAAGKGAGGSDQNEGSERLDKTESRHKLGIKPRIERILMCPLQHTSPLIGSLSVHSTPCNPSLHRKLNPPTKPNTEATQGREAPR